METISPPAPQPANPQPAAPQPAGPTPPGSPPPPGSLPPDGFGPTPDPTRTGALWVGGAGVALLLAAAAVLTAVRWDEIGQSVKLGGLVALTLAMLAAGRRLSSSIPMTAQAIFHLGALLVPFDMAAVAILAGQSWQQTLLLTSLTSVGAWYGIHRAVPSQVLLWCARGAVVALASGIAAVSGIAMPLALAGAAAAAVIARKPIAAALWATIAGLLPLASVMWWPPRLAAAMADLGFSQLDRWQTIAAGGIATLAMIGTTRLIPRAELAWAAVGLGVVTALVTLGMFGESGVGYVLMASAFVGAELVAWAARRDVLWGPIVTLVADIAEALALIATALLFMHSLVVADTFLTTPVSSMVIASALFSFGWLTADRRRLKEPVDWLTGVAFGANWAPTTVLFPLAVLSGVLAASAAILAVSLTALALAYWMIATWRTGAEYGAVVLVAVAAGWGVDLSPWLQLGVGAIGAGLLMLAAQQRLRSGDDLGAAVAAAGSVIAGIVMAVPAVQATTNRWPLLLVIAGSWALSWIVEAKRGSRNTHPLDYLGRTVAAGGLIAAVAYGAPAVGIAAIAIFITLCGIDYYRTDSAGQTTTGYALCAGATLGLVGVPITAALGLAIAPAGVAFTVAGFVAAGIAMALPHKLELPLAAAAVVSSALGLVMAFGEAGAFAVALITTGCTACFAAAALRDLVFATSGYVAVCLGVALQLAVWEVTWIEPYLVLPAIAALAVGRHFQRQGASSWATYVPTIAVMTYVSIADRVAGGSAWHAVIAGAIAVIAIIAGGYRRLVGPLITGSVALAAVVGYESLGPAALVPTWAWLATGGAVLLSAGVAMERSDMSPLERGQQLRNVIATQFS